LFDLIGIRRQPGDITNGIDRAERDRISRMFEEALEQQ
jgi:hypothetical protein